MIFRVVKLICQIFVGNIVTEDAILKWYKDGHSSKGKMHFLEQMKVFVNWLQHAEEGTQFFYYFFFVKQTFANLPFILETDSDEEEED